MLDHESGWLDCCCCCCCCWLGQEMLNQRHLQETTQLNLSLTVALLGPFAVILIQLLCPYIISGHLCCRVRNFEQGQYRDKHRQKKRREWRRNNVALLSFYGGRVILQKTPAMIRMITPMSGEMSQNGPIALSQDDSLYKSTECWTNVRNSTVYNKGPVRISIPYVSACCSGLDPPPPHFYFQQVQLL